MAKTDIIELLTDYFHREKIHDVVILTDRNVDQHYPDYFSGLSEHVRLDKLVISPGEKTKSIQTATDIWDYFAKKQYDRSVFLLNFGGGMVTDLGGYVASSYKRGIRYANCPTTLLAMIDAAIGGKNGVNLPCMKNAVGTFYFSDIQLPVDLSLLSTLPKEEFLSGFGENSEKAKYILSSNLSMAKQMGMQSLCEGVETPEQLEYLRTIGFEKAQGYYFGKPMSLDNIFELNLPIENLKDTPYYEKLGKIEIPDQEVMNHAGVVIADVREKAIYEIKNNELFLLTKNRNYDEWLKTLNENSKTKLRKYFLDLIQNNKQKDFYIFSNGNLFSTNIHYAAENSRTNSEAWVIEQRELTHLPLNKNSDDNNKVYEIYKKLLNLNDNFIMLD